MKFHSNGWKHFSSTFPLYPLCIILCARINMWCDEHWILFKSQCLLFANRICENFNLFLCEQCSLNTMLFYSDNRLEGPLSCAKHYNALIQILFSVEGNANLSWNGVIISKHNNSSIERAVPIALERLWCEHKLMVCLLSGVNFLVYMSIITIIQFMHRAKTVLNALP